MATFDINVRPQEMGLKPLEGELAAIDRLQTKTDLARYFARMFKLNLINPLVGFVDGYAQEPTREILYIYQGGLGLPDRDYYLQDDPKLEEYRRIPRPLHAVAIAGEPAGTRSCRPGHLRARNTISARAHWTNVESRDAVKTYTKRGSQICRLSSQALTGQPGHQSSVSPTHRQ